MHDLNPHDLLKTSRKRLEVVAPLTHYSSRQPKPPTMSYQQPESYEQQPPADAAGYYEDDSEDEWAAPAKDLATGAGAVTGEAKVTEVDYAAMGGEERELAGDVVPVVFFVAANGDTFKRNYVMGHTIGYIKGQLEDLKGWPYGRIILKLNGKLLIDPLSLNDLPFTPNVDNVVEVTFTPE